MTALRQHLTQEMGPQKGLVLQRTGQGRQVTAVGEGVRLMAGVGVTHPLGRCSWDGPVIVRTDHEHRPVPSRRRRIRGGEFEEHRLLGDKPAAARRVPVSYTHLTLPTICSV